MRVFVIFLAACAAGCSSVETQEAKYREGAFPETGVRTSATVGEVIVNRYNYLANESAVVRAEVGGSFWKGRRRITAGEALVSAIAGNKNVYCQPPLGLGAPCLFDSDNDRMFDTAYTLNAYGFAVNGSSIAKVPYTASESTIQDGFKYELVYQGVDRDVVKIAYREYSDNLARPAYRQDLSYNLSDGDTQISFREVRLTVHSADNNEIYYTVSAGF